MSTARERLRARREELDEAASATSEWISEAAHEAVDELSQRMEKIENRLRNASRRAGDKAHEAQDEVSSYVQRKPIAALGIAAATGALIGLLFSRK